jgi:hypothetical protein
MRMRGAYQPRPDGEKIDLTNPPKGGPIVMYRPGEVRRRERPPLIDGGEDLPIDGGEIVAYEYASAGRVLTFVFEDVRVLQVLRDGTHHLYAMLHGYPHRDHYMAPGWLRMTIHKEE